MPSPSADPNVGDFPGLFRKHARREPSGKLPSRPPPHNRVLQVTICARIPLRTRLSLSSGGLGAETFCPLERRRWWLEGGIAPRPGRWVRAREPGTSALDSTRLHLGSNPAAARLGKACCKTLSRSRRKLPSVFFALGVVRTLGTQR